MGSYVGEKYKPVSQVDAMITMIDYLSIETGELSPVTAFILQMAKENLMDDGEACNAEKERPDSFKPPSP